MHAANSETPHALPIITPVEFRFIRLREVERLAGLKKSKLYQLMKDGKFPKPYKLGMASVWLLEEVVAWMHSARLH